MSKPEYCKKLTYKELDKFLLELDSEKKEPKFVAGVFCKDRGFISFTDQTPLCIDTKCKWCRGIDKAMKKYGDEILKKT